MSNLLAFYKLLLNFEKTNLDLLNDMEQKINIINKDMDDLKNTLDNPSKFIRKLKSLVYDYDIKNIDVDYIEQEMKNKVGFNYELRAYNPLKNELDLILKNFKGEKRNIKSILKDVSKLKACFNQDAFLVKSFDLTSLKTIQRILAQMEISFAAKTVENLNKYNTRLIKKSLSKEIESKKITVLNQIVGANSVVKDKVVVPKISVADSKVLLKAQDVISRYQEALSTITEDEKDCYELIVSEEEYIFNLAVNNQSNLKVAVLVLTYLVNRSVDSGLTIQLEKTILDVLSSIDILEQIVSREEQEILEKAKLEKEKQTEKNKLVEQEKREISLTLDAESKYLESLNKYNDEFEENNISFNKDDWNYIEALNGLNAPYYLTQKGTDVYKYCIHLINISKNLTENNYLKYYKLSQILNLKASLINITDNDKLKEAILTLKSLVHDYEEFLTNLDVSFITEDKIEHSNNLVIYLQSRNKTLVEDFLFNDKTVSKNINLSHVNSLAYLFKVLKDGDLGYIRKNSTKIKGDNLEDKDIRVIASGSSRVAFKLYNREYDGKVIPVISIISAGIKFGDDKSFYDYINSPSILNEINQFEVSTIPTIFDGKNIDEIIGEYNTLEQKILNNLTNYINNGHRLSGNLNIG